MGWIGRVVRRERLERELDAELQFHVAEEVKRLQAEGVAPEEARRRALASFGGLEPIKEQARDARGTRWLEDLSRDVRYAFRMMRRSPVFTLAAVLSLAVGIGANAAIFSISDALLLRPLDVTRPNELVFLNRAGFSEPNYRFSYPGLTRFQQAVGDVQFGAFGSLTSVQIDREGGAELALGQLVSANWFDVLGVGAAAGRVLAPADAPSPGGAPVVVLSHDFWARKFGADPHIVGSSLRVNGVPLTVVGVAAEGFVGVVVGQRVDLWAPATMQHELRFRGNASIDNADPSQPWVTQDGVQWLTIVARLPPAVNRAQAASRIAAVRRQEAEREAAQIQDSRRRQFALREHVELVDGARGQSFLRDSFSQPLIVLMVTVAAVLLIACANLASLLLARSAARGREFALRLSLGAARGRVVRQLLAESLTLAGLGGLAGLVVARLGGHVLLVLASSSGTSAIPLDLPLNGRLVAFTLGVSLVTGVLFGLGPAIRSSRPNLVDPLKAGARVAGAERRAGAWSFGKVLIALQVALSFALLVGALLFLRTFRNLVTVDTGFDRASVLVARFDPILSGITEAQLPDLYARLIDRARAIPGVSHAALALSGPVTGSRRVSSVSVDDEPMRAGNDADAREEYVSADYFHTAGIRLLGGRTFTADDVDKHPKVAVVNETLARHFFGDRNPVGHRIGYGSPADTEIVGVVGDARVDGPKDDVPPMAYYPLAQNPGEFARNLFIRVSGPSDAAKGALRAAIAEVNRHLAVREVTTLADLNERMVSNDRVVSRLTGFFGLLAVFVACLGLYGTVAYSVARRTNEIGVRMALGATRGRVGWLVLRETLVLVAAGGVLGLAVVWPLLKYLTSLLYGISPHDPVAFAGAAAGLLSAGALAGVIPAWRASQVDPLTALRAD
ncbi:MAG TPA: ABC transporter permease [Vicinamibacterales bacterium]|nr:ABC transporter permease [Vicinamibacterales bacterium]